MILAIVTLLILSLGLAVAAQHVQATRLLVDRLDEQTQLDLDVVSQRNRLTFALIKMSDTQQDASGALFTDPASAPLAGLEQTPDAETLLRELQSEGVFPSDLLGQSFRVAPGISVTVIPQTGLVDLNSKNEAYLEYIAGRLGAPRPRAFVAALRDFTDEDRVVRFDGAEQSSYGPLIRVPNAPLRHQDQICDVRGWASLDICQNAELRAMSLSAGSGGGLVIDHASEALKSTLLETGISVQRRSNDWFSIAQRNDFIDYVLAGNSGRGDYRILFRFDNRPELFGVTSLRIMPSTASHPFETRESEIRSRLGSG